jgi:hypothetical protein
MKQRRFVFGALVVSTAFAILASCSLGLDESLIGKADTGAPPDDSPSGDTGPKDGGNDGPPPINPEAGVCTKDEDCKSPGDGCLKPHCDVPRKACVFDVCKPAACQSSACDTVGRTCAQPPKTRKYASAQFPVGAPVGCGSPRACFAVVYPYVFVGTPNGVLGFSAADPASTAPTPVSVTGLGFVPTLLVTSGSRVYFLGGAVGTGASSRLQIGYIDVPPDPFRKSIEVQTILATYNRPTSEPGFSLTLYPRANDTALLVDYNPAQSYPSTAIEPPLVEPLSLSSTTIPLTAGTQPLITSGLRLVMQSLTTPSGTGTYELIANAGAAATNGGSVPFPPAPDAGVVPVSPPQTLAVDPQGGVLWMLEYLTQAPNNPAPPGALVKTIRAFFLLADGSANFDFTKGVDVEVYPPSFGPGAGLVGPAAMIDTNSAIIATAEPSNAAQSNVQIVTKQPTALVAGKKQRLTTNAVGTLGAAASNGYGYILAAESATASSVYVFDPACAP